MTLLLSWSPRLSHWGHLSFLPLPYLLSSDQSPRTDRSTSECLGVRPFWFRFEDTSLVQGESTPWVMVINDLCLIRALTLITSSPINSTFISQNFPPEKKKNPDFFRTYKVQFSIREQSQWYLAHCPLLFSSAFSLPLNMGAYQYSPRPTCWYPTLNLFWSQPELNTLSL